MNINDYFGNYEGKSNHIDHKQSDKQNQMKNFVGKLNKFLTSNIIDEPEYTFLKNFMKSKGKIVSAQRYYEILHKIQQKVSKEDYQELKDACNNLFKHIHDLFKDGVDKIEDMDIGNFIQEIEEYHKFKFTLDQKNAINQLCFFLYDNSIRTFGLYGFAGTGKTTTMTKFVHYLIYKNYLESMVLSAPTNTAVNVMKSKFRADLGDLISKKLKITDLPEDFDDLIEKLEEKGFKIHFLTTHKLLNYTNDFNMEGDRIFIKGEKSTLDNYDLVIVDESSMLPIQIVTHLFEEAYKQNTKRSPKILFMGDPAQLPPVNERLSMIFAKDHKDFNFAEFQKIFLNNKASYDYDKNLMEMMQKRFDNLKGKILGMNNIVLKEVMRSNNSQVIGLCNEIRSWVLNEIKIPKFHQYKGNKVFLYKYNEKKKKIDSEWFKKCVEYNQCKNDKDHLSNIILTWTNKASDEYNNNMRQILFKKEKLNKFEIGDMLIFVEFYNIRSDDDKKPKNKDDNIFYTSEQIRVTDIDTVVKAIPEFTESLPKKPRGIKNILDIEEKYVRAVKAINQHTKRKYNVWKLYVHKLKELMQDTIPNTYQIYVIDDESKKVLQADREFASEEIKKLRNYYRNIHKEHIDVIDHEIIRSLWKELNKKFVDPFANVNLSCSITVHKSQSATFYNVFVDLEDILRNPRKDEAKRTLYTACTRVSNELHLLI